MTYPLSILIVLKNGEINSLNIKDFKEDDLFKKCGFKTITNFNKQHEWNIELDNVYYIISMYGKNVGKCNMLNTYVFPSPINNITYFGSCCLVASTTNNGTMSMSTHLNLNSNLWDLLCVYVIYYRIPQPRPQRLEHDRVDIQNHRRQA